MADEPGPSKDVLAERIDNVGKAVDRLDQRLNGLATQRQITDLINGRDALYQSRLDSLTEDIKDLTAAHAAERTERIAADRENEERANRARTFALSAIGLVVTVVLGLVALINQLGGTPG